jgi:hypothetical protein
VKTPGEGAACAERSEAGDEVKNHNDELLYLLIYR